MADTWTYAAGVWTLAMDGTGTGQESRHKAITGLTASTLYTFYSTVNADSAAPGPFIEVDGGDRTTITSTGSHLQFVRGTTDGSGNITLRRGVSDAGDAPAGGGSDGFEYASEGAMNAGGWTKTASGVCTLTVGSTTHVHGGTKALKFTQSGGSHTGQCDVTKTFTGLTPGGTYTSTIYAYQDSRTWWDTGSRLIVNGVSGTHGTVTVAGSWVQLTVTTTANGSGELGVVIRRAAGIANQSVNVWFDDFAIAGVGGTSDVTWTDWDYCIGTGMGDGGTGLGDGDDPIPIDDFPRPVTGGTRLFGAWDLPAGGAYYWNGGPKHFSASNTANLVNTAGSVDGFAAFIPGGRPDWMSGGRFSYDRWKASFDAILDNTNARNALEDGITSGVLPFHYVIDEPDVDSARYGGDVPFTTVERMCIYSKSLGAPFNTWPTCIGVSPDRTWMVRHMVGLDWMFRDYSLNRGDIATWVTANQTRATALGHVFAPGIHYVGFDRPRDGNVRPVTPSEFRHYGGYIAALSGTPFFWGWTYASWVVAQPGWNDAHRYVRDLFASHDP